MLVVELVILFQGIVLTSVVCKFITHFLRAYYFKRPILLLDISSVIGEVVYGIDVGIHLLHAFWPLVRLHMRVYRRNLLLLAYDVCTVLPFTFTCEFTDYKLALAKGCFWEAKQLTLVGNNPLNPYTSPPGWCKWSSSFWS